jgi:plasmid stability protein
MSTLTIRNVLPDIVDNIKKVANMHGCSMEQEIRALLERQYISKVKILKSIEETRSGFKSVSPDDIDKWIEKGR